MSVSEHAIAAPAPADSGIAARLDRVIGTALELVTASLVAVEIVILFVGIVARYAFHNPLIWSDELASMLFLWLAMLGGALALRRNEHMRMTALVTRAPAHLRAFFDAPVAVRVPRLPAGAAAAGHRLRGQRIDRVDDVARHLDELARRRRCRSASG